MRQILPNELIVEFDKKKENNSPKEEIQEETNYWINLLKEWFIKNGFSLYITNHNGISYHIRFQIDGLEKHNHQFRKKYKELASIRLIPEIMSKLNKLNE